MVHVHDLKSKYGVRFPLIPLYYAVLTYPTNFTREQVSSPAFGHRKQARGIRLSRRCEQKDPLGGLRGPQVGGGRGADNVHDRPIGKTGEATRLGPRTGVISSGVLIIYIR